MAGSLWLFILPYATAAAFPGPAQGVMVAQVLARGAPATVLYVVGMIVGNALWLGAAIFGLVALAARLAAPVAVIKWGGVAFLLFVAWKIWSLRDSIAASPVVNRGGTGLLGGLLLTLGNPKAAVFFGAILPQAFDMTALSAAQIVLILALGIGIDSCVQSFYLMTAARARVLFTTPARMRIINRGAALLIAATAAFIALRS
jgi:threonine/homoserine/homoserine lactone efflux protein